MRNVLRACARAFCWPGAKFAGEAVWASIRRRRDSDITGAPVVTSQPECPLVEIMFGHDFSLRARGMGFKFVWRLCTSNATSMYVYVLAMVNVYVQVLSDSKQNHQLLTEKIGFLSMIRAVFRD